jgi:hypothetical protein
MNFIPIVVVSGYIVMFNPSFLTSLTTYSKYSFMSSVSNGICPTPSTPSKTQTCPDGSVIDASATCPTNTPPPTSSPGSQGSPDNNPNPPGNSSPPPSSSGGDNGNPVAVVEAVAAEDYYLK